jgi:glucosamine-6-phosphate deaminase
VQVEVRAPSDWAESVSGVWEARLRERPGLRMVLPTGATPLPVYEAVTASGVSFAGATVFLLDEFGGLPPGHPQRCDTMIRPFLDRVDLPPEGLVRLDPDASDLQAECRRYQARVDEGRLDLVLLGLGRNGHLGLNEPGSSSSSTTRVVDLAPGTVEGASRYGGEGAPTFGMTLGMASILAAREVWLLVTGPAKHPILDRVLTGPVTDALPASHLRTHPNAVIWADTDAAPPAFYDPRGTYDDRR